MINVKVNCFRTIQPPTQVIKQREGKLFSWQFSRPKSKLYVKVNCFYNNSAAQKTSNTSNKLILTEEKRGVTASEYKYNFQQRMSRLPQLWRTQRNAIRVANCKTSWIIKTFNAHCAVGFFPVACLLECLCTPPDELPRRLIWERPGRWQWRIASLPK